MTCGWQEQGREQHGKGNNMWEERQTVPQHRGSESLKYETDMFVVELQIAIRIDQHVVNVS